MTAPTQTAPAETPAAPDNQPSDQATPNARWRALLVPFNKVSGDGRMIEPPSGDLRVRPLPLPILHQVTLEDEHTGAVVVGNIDEVNADEQGIWARGAYDLQNPAATEAARQVEGGFSRGISIDLDDVTVETRCIDMDGNTVDCPAAPEISAQAADETAGVRVIEVATDYRVMDAVIVAQPAFAEAFIEADPDPQGDWPAPGSAQDGGDGQVANPANAPAVPKAETGPMMPAMSSIATSSYTVTGDANLPIADRTRPWDGSAAGQRIAAMAGGVGNIDPSIMSRGFFWRDPDMDPTLVTAYRFGFADVVNGRMQAIPRGIFAAAGVLQGARGGTTIPQSDQDGIRSRINGYYSRMRSQFNDPSIVPPWEASTRESLEAAGIGSWRPDAAWFDNPQLSAPTHLVVRDDGRVYGHLASWNDTAGRPACHIGFPGTCVTVPHSATGYAYFHCGHVETDRGPIAVGTITAGCDHAGPRKSFAEATAWYANSGNGVAVGCVGEDAHGIWFAGSIVPGVSDAQIATLQHATISPDWREVAGNLEMVGALCVNTGGFPMPRAAAIGDRQLSLVAAGAIAYTPLTMLDLPRIAAAVRELDQAAELVARHAANRAERVAGLAGAHRRHRAETLAASIRTGGAHRV